MHLMEKYPQCILWRKYPQCILWRKSSIVKCFSNNFWKYVSHIVRKWSLYIWETVKVQIHLHSQRVWSWHCLLLYSTVSIDHSSRYIALDKALFSTKKCLYFSYYSTKMCCGYSLEAPRQGTSNEYPQHMFSSRNKKTINLISLLI